MALNSILAAVTIAGSTPQAAPAAASVPQAAPARPQPSAHNDRTVRLNVSLIVNGSPAGDVAVETTAAGIASVDFTQLIALISPNVEASLVADLTKRAGGRAMVPIADLTSAGFPIFFDFAALQLRVDVPADARAIRTISLSGGDFLAGAVPGEPSDFAFGVSVTLAERLRSRGILRDFEREPTNLLSQGFVNFGGKNGYYLTFQAGLREGDRPYRRKSTLFHDDVGRAIRYAVGDVDPLVMGSFATPTSLFGVSVERLYQTIQPYRNLRPSGRGALTLERPSRVEVLVNGAPYRTLNLAPGRYDVRDFPFLDGLNDVRLVVRDDSGRDETIGVSFFSDVELLSRGISIFSLAAGVRQDSFGQFNATRYRRDPMVSGLFQRGLTDSLTVGASFQSDKRNSLASGQIVIGTPIGLLEFEAALDRNDMEPLQTAASISYRLVRPSTRGNEQRLDLDFQYHSRRFSPLAPADLFRNRYMFDINARFQTPLPGRFFGIVGAGYSRAYGSRTDLKTATVGVSKSFRRLIVNGNYTYRNDSVGRDHRFLLSVSLSFGKRNYVRSSFDSSTDRVSLDYSRQAFEGLNQAGVDVSIGRDSTGSYGNLDLQYFANRAQVLVSHDYARTGGFTEQRTDVAVTTGIGYADGQLAIGRDPGRGFVIVSKDASLKNSRVTVSNRYTLGPSARTGVFGPALVPTERSYQADSLEVAVDKLPLGYDIGAGRLNIVPGAASGYTWKIGSASSNTVVGHIVGRDGKPVAYLTGLLQPLDDPKAIPVPFFTNGTGRLVAQKLAPGRFAIVPAGKSSPIGEIVVPKGATGLVDVGTLTAKE